MKGFLKIDYLIIKNYNDWSTKFLFENVNGWHVPVKCIVGIRYVQDNIDLEEILNDRLYVNLKYPLYVVKCHDKSGTTVNDNKSIDGSLYITFDIKAVESILNPVDPMIELVEQLKYNPTIGIETSMARRRFEKGQKDEIDSNDI
jgi:hypothetical protein